MLLLASCFLFPHNAFAETTPRLFSWKRDPFFETLEQTYNLAKQQPPGELRLQFDKQLVLGRHLLDQLSPASEKVPYEALKELEEVQFQIATLAAAQESLMIEANDILADARVAVLRAAGNWPVGDPAEREAIYRVVYGGRAAIEEAIMQHKANVVPSITVFEDIPSATPSVVVEGVRVHSGDIILSRGEAPTSALIARGNHYPGSFSHVAFVHVDELTGAATVVESLIEQGGVLTPAADFLKEKRHRLLLLRLRPANRVLQQDPLAPHRAAGIMLERIRNKHIPYDFSMNWNDDSKMFCSEVAYHGYRAIGIDLWADKSKLESPGLVRWLGDMGVTHFTTIVPSDLEYDPRLAPVAEWRNLESLSYDRLDNVTLDVLLEAAERGDRLGYTPLMLLPGVATKFWSGLKSVVGATPAIPDGMSVGTALRIRSLIKVVHPKLRAAIAAADVGFRAEHGYPAPFWTLTAMARQTLAAMRKDLNPALTVADR